MRQPTVRDNGQQVELDLHGATISRAKSLIRSAVIICADRGRSTLKIIHGYSTSVDPRKTTSIRDELYIMLEAGDLTDVVGDHRFEGSTILSLGMGSIPIRRRITLGDIERRW